MNTDGQSTEVPERREFFASALPGGEAAVCAELRELGFQAVRLNRGGIPFLGCREDGWRACLLSRTAQRIQWLRARFRAPDETALYRAVQAIDWSTILTSRQTLSVRAVARGGELTHDNYVALKAKDAIVDQLRDRTGARPSVDREDADVRVFVYLAADKGALYLDLAGEPLHRRGYRIQTGEAPLRETLAATLLRLSGWDRKTPLIDPMCGTGTLAIEAAQWAENRAPGLARQQFGFERWSDFTPADAAYLHRYRGELRQSVRHASPRIQASDRDPAMVAAARVNARAAGVRLSFRDRDVEQLQGTHARVHVITNPPFGQRLTLVSDFPRRFGATISRWHGWRVSILAGSPAYRKAIFFKPVSVYPLRNGDLDCELLNYEVP